MGHNRRMDDATPGSLIADRYLLERPLGSGGTATVWAATDVVLGRPVAVKMLAASGDPAASERLHREARALAALAHPHIVTVFDFLEVPAGYGPPRPVLVTELLDGTGLDTRLVPGPLRALDAVGVCAQVADALAAAHRAGIVHRDVKPGNVMLTDTGVKLLDFGIARGLEDPNLTGSMVVGTPACMAPEQITGRHVGPAADVYALGCLLYWCLTGQPPYPLAELTALAHAHLTSPAPPLPALPGITPSIGELYEQCLNKDPNARPDAEHVYRTLTAALTPAAQPPVGEHGTRLLPPQSQSAPSRRRLVPAAVIATGVIVAGLLAWSLAGNSSTATPRTSAPASTPSAAQITVPANATTTAATSTLPNPATDPAGYLAAMISQINAMATAATPGQAQNAYQDLGNALTDLQHTVTAAQSGNQKQWRDVQSRITDLEHRIADDTNSGQITTADATQLTGELQQLSTAVPTGKD